MIAVKLPSQFRIWHLPIAVALLLHLTQCKAPAAMQDSDTVTFTTVFQLTSATKDGYYMEGYVVEIPEGKAKRLDGKKVRVTGKVIVRPGIGPGIDRSGNAVQGREDDTYLISNPTIEIIK